VVAPAQVTLLPDAGPLITLAYANALDVLLLPGWQLGVVDMVAHEVTRNQTPTSAKLSKWLHKQTQRGAAQMLTTQTFKQHAKALATQSLPRRANLGELALQEAINQLALARPPQPSVLLFEDHRIAKSSFFVPQDCQRVSTRAFLLFLEQSGYIASAAAIEREAILAGRAFSQMKFGPA
jgi:hypothetical protein